MVSPDVAVAVERLAQRGSLAPEQVRLFGRTARGELVSLSTAIHGLLYLGVAALTTGAGLLFRHEIANLGPITIALAVALAAALCLGWVARRAAPYSNTLVEAPHFAFDSFLVLGALLIAADLAFVEGQFVALGANWVYHLLLVSVGYAALAFRFDSRTLFGLALTSFAAWRGIAAARLERSIFGFFDESNLVRLNALGCGLLFLALGRFLRDRAIKAHFEPTAVHLGWLLVLQSIAWGLVDGRAAGPHRFALIAVGAGLAWFSWRGGRFVLFVFGVLAAYLGLLVTMADVVDNTNAILFLASASSIALVLGLAVIHRRFPDAEDLQ